jgi:hypothetical protein
MLWGWVRVLIVVVIEVCGSGAVVDGDCCGAVELAAAVAFLFVEDAEELGKETALLGVLGLLAVGEPGGHGFTGDFFKLCDVDATLAGHGVGVLVYDEAEDVHEKDDALWILCQLESI